MADHKEEGNCLEELIGDQSSPHEAIFFALSCLPLFELLVMSQVCKSLRDAIRDDILPWLNIMADGSLSLRLTDDILIKVASKAKGGIRVLALINCLNITDDALLSIVAQNPLITKLHLPGCTKLTPAGVIRAVKLLTKNYNHRLKSLRISGIYGIQKEDLRTLHRLINPSQTEQQKQGKILYQHEHNIKFSSLKNEEITYTIDVDVCPKCEEVRMVYDCPQVLVCGRKRDREYCRGCIFCIPRCVECGVCIADTEEVEEAACPDTLCAQCWLHLPKCDFCNKPYCKQHTNQWQKYSSGFVCASCHSKFVS